MSALYKYALQKPWVRDLIEKRIAALKAVRESPTRAVTEKPTFGTYRGDGSGIDNVVDFVGDTVVKAPHHWKQVKGDKLLKRRAFMKSELEKQGVAPETFLVETKKNKYLVQPKGETASPYSDLRYEASKQGDYLRRKLENLGYRPGRPNHAGIDVHADNVARYGDDWKVIDTGHMAYPHPTDRKSALEKFISYGRRDKPWLK